MSIEKAIAISDAKIHYVSLVDKAANMERFLITKAEDGQAKFAALGKILKADDSTHYVTGIVYEPLVEDAHGNFMTEDEIRKAAYWFAKNGDKIDIQHSFEKAEGLTVVETYIAPSAMEIAGEKIAKGTWLMTVEVQNDDVWEAIQKGSLTGFSMGGVGKYSDVDVEIPEAAEKESILKRLAGMLGIEIVEKGKVKDRYDTQSKSSNFWSAWNALEETLRHYDWQTDSYEFVEDAGEIRAALTDFSEIVTGLLTAPNLFKALADGAPVEKAGKKISGKRHSALQSIYDNLGNLLSELADEDNDKKEENTVEKSEVLELIKEQLEPITKALEELKPAAPDAGAAPEAEPMTADAIQKMVEDSVKKALEPETAPLTSEAVQKMIAETVEKAVEPVLKARGVPSNLNDDGSAVEKNEGQHYLAGIL